MSLFDGAKRAFARSQIMHAASRKFIAGDSREALAITGEYILKDELLRQVVTAYDVSSQDLINVFSAMRDFTYDEVHKGLVIPIIALLNMDTFSYLMRAERGQVTKADAYKAVRDFLVTNGAVFRPERDYRTKHGL